MSNLKIDKALEEQYVDASAALIMDQYTQRLSQKLEQEMENADVVFPKSLDQRCQQMIKDECARIRRKARLHKAQKLLNRAAIIFVALIALGGILFMTVDAVRIPIMNFFIEKQGDSWTITGKSEDDPILESLTRSDFEFTNLYANRIPWEFGIKEIFCDDKTSFFGVFGNDNNQEIRLSVSPAEATVSVDSENVDLSMDVLINNHAGVLLVEDEYCRLAWIQDEVILAIISRNMDYTDVISLAETISGPAQ